MIDRSKWTRERERKKNSQKIIIDNRDTEVANKNKKKNIFLINGRIFFNDSHFYDDLMML